MGEVSAALAVANTVLGMQQASQQRKAQAAQIAHRQQQAALQQRIEERKLARERRQQEATARARFGASGISANGGSAAAVLRGLNKDYDDALADSRAIYSSRMGVPNLLDDGPGLGQIIGLGQDIIGLGQTLSDSFSQKTGGQASKVGTPISYSRG
ncbi:hypothetical protein HH303_12040 [Rhodospirillaceae bacterium KN72]|uniref:Uncharacterized protein n=1 Tax=Pacificispira spongiicola TaxID=2729598 RepID=A0A7Y0E0X5_9PROT|nr:hypothetical protein [Pacificispira spongiicola]NMM45214.1 hypothetical protein [Pacificispira spongiicola]